MCIVIQVMEVLEKHERPGFEDPGGHNAMQAYSHRVVADILGAQTALSPHAQRVVGISAITQ